MPAYEAALILRKAAHPVLKGALATACNGVFRHGGIIQNMENLGLRELPHPLRHQGKKVSKGHYFVIQFHSSPEAMKLFETDCYHIKQIARVGVIRKEEEPKRPCEEGPCLFGELPNPEHERSAYRKSVLRRLKNKNVTNIL